MHVWAEFVDRRSPVEALGRLHTDIARVGGDTKVHVIRSAGDDFTTGWLVCQVETQLGLIRCCLAIGGVVHLENDQVVLSELLSGAFRKGNLFHAGKVCCKITCQTGSQGNQFRHGSFENEAVMNDGSVAWFDCRSFEPDIRVEWTFREEVFVIHGSLRGDALKRDRYHMIRFAQRPVDRFGSFGFGQRISPIAPGGATIDPVDQGGDFFIAHGFGVAESAVFGIGVPGRHFTCQYGGLDETREFLNDIITGHCPRGDVSRCMTGKAVLLQHGGDVFTVGGLRKSVHAVGHAKGAEPGYFGL